jgi:RNA polymerase-binding transcription factor DksA
MTTNKLGEYKNKLQKERELIEEEIRQKNQPPNFGRDPGGLNDSEEETDQADALTSQLAIVQDLKNRLADIESALRKIESGRYGTCEKCGKEIGESILDIDPESHFCQDCKLSA